MQLLVPLSAAAASRNTSEEVGMEARHIPVTVRHVNTFRVITGSFVVVIIIIVIFIILLFIIIIIIIIHPRLRR